MPVTIFGCKVTFFVQMRDDNIMTSKQRAYLKSLAQTQDAIFQIGKNSLTPEMTKAVAEALEARELIKISILKNCMEDGHSVAEMLSERTHSQVVQVIGKKIVLYNTSVSALLQYKEQALKKIADVFEIFKMQADKTVLLWRPHPLIESAIGSMRPQLRNS